MADYCWCLMRECTDTTYSRRAKKGKLLAQICFLIEVCETTSSVLFHFLDLYQLRTVVAFLIQCTLLCKLNIYTVRKLMSILQKKLTRYINSDFIFEISTTQLYKNDIFHRCNRNFVKNCIPVLIVSSRLLICPFQLLLLSPFSDLILFKEYSGNNFHKRLH